MLLSLWLAALTPLLWPTSAQASSLTSIQCQAPQNGKSICEVRIEGAIEAGERLFLPNAEDSDKLFFGETLLGSTGYLLKHRYAAPFFPRVYSLQPLQGSINPVLRLESQAYFERSTTPFQKAKVIPATFSLRKTYLPLFLRTMAFGLLLLLSGFVITCIRRTTIDGWTYPVEEMRWFFGSLCSFLILHSEHSHVLAPGIWSADFHLTATKTCLAVSLWCLSSLLQHVRFNDRSCVERGLYHRPSAHFRGLSALALLASLALIAPPLRAGYAWIVAPQALPLLLNLQASIRSLEWKRVLKRSASSPLLFHFSLLALAAWAAAFPLLTLLSFTERFLATTTWAVLMFGAWRMHRYFKAQRRGRALVRECRDILLGHAKAEGRLHALCEFIEDEWAAARVSVISVENQLGLVIASAGPDAIPDVQHSRARKLGPFLRRVCREGHILYAPVAEELGADLQSKGLKHSSLAIPLRQQGKVRAVLCVMADEGERIPPIDATLLELLTNDLSLEILSAVAQHVAEKKCEHLLTIARQADGVAVEHLDNWGHLHYSEKEENRFLIGAKLDSGAMPLSSSAVKKAHAEFNRELRAIWHALALSFEFVPREIKEDFWVLSPKEFRNPYLASLGVEKVSILLAMALDRQARILAAKEGYLLLAQPLAKIAAGAAKLHLVSYGAQENGAYEIDPLHFERLRRLRNRATSSGPLLLGAIPQPEKIQTRMNLLGKEEEIEFFSILAVFADKKEIRKIENKALETARESLRKAA